MTLAFRKCPICNGAGRILIRNTRVNLFDKLLNKNSPLLKDSEKNCDNCKGSGKLYLKTNPMFNPWNPFGKDK